MLLGWCRAAVHGLSHPGSHRSYHEEETTPFGSRDHPLCPGERGLSFGPCSSDSGVGQGNPGAVDARHYTQVAILGSCRPLLGQSLSCGQSYQPVDPEAFERIAVTEDSEERSG